MNASSASGAVHLQPTGRLAVPSLNQPPRQHQVSAVMTLGFMVGILSLLISLAVSGWVRSRGMGWVTTGISMTGLLAVAWLTIRVG